MCPVFLRAQGSSHRFTNIFSSQTSRAAPPQAFSPLCQHQGDERLLPLATFAFSFSSSSFSELSELLTGSGTLIFSGMAASSSFTFLLREFEGVLREQNLHQNGEKKYLEQTRIQLFIHTQVRFQPKATQHHSSTALKRVKEVFL